MISRSQRLARYVENQSKIDVGNYRLGSVEEPAVKLRVVLDEGKLFIVLPNGVMD